MIVKLAAKGWAGVAPEVNVKNPLHPGEEACNWEIYTGR